MKLRKFGSLVGLLSLSLVAPACGDDDGAESTDSSDESDESDEGDAGESDESDTTETDESDESDESDTTEADASDSTDSTDSSETDDTSEADASDVTTDEGDAAAGDDESDASGAVETDAGTEEVDAGEDNPPPPPPECAEDPEITFAPTEITDDTTWDCDHIYVLSQDTLTVVANATLTIAPGTTVVGETGGGLVITSTGKIDANGQANAPITFTSAKNPGSRAMGDWGGILLLGKAPINAEGGQAEAEGVPTTAGYAEFGGEDEEHDCGSMSYVRIQFSGFEVSPDNELNGLGVAGCGSDTELHHIQAHRGSDDGFEFWGGAPQVHHLVSSQNDDDLFDWTDGFQSSIQFLVLQNSGSDNGVEGDNSEANYALEPRTMPRISNMTLVGSNTNGILLRRGSWGKFYNSIILNNTISAVDLRDDESLAGTEDGSLTIQNSIFFGNGEDAQFADDPTLDSEFDEAAYFEEEEFANLFDVDPKLIDPENPTEPNFMPEDDTVLEGAVNPPAGMYDTTAKYIGAFEPGGEDWTAGWTEYPEN